MSSYRAETVDDNDIERKSDDESDAGAAPAAAL